MKRIHSGGSPHQRHARAIQGAPGGQLHVKNFITIAPVQSGRTDYGDEQRVVARSAVNYEESRPSREEVRRSNYERRADQMSGRGFRSSRTKPYRELGEVELDDQQLIMRAVGQDRRVRHGSVSSGTDEMVDLSQFSSSSTIGLKIQANTTDLSKLTLREQISTANKRLFDVKQGRGLFKLIKLEEEQRLKRREQAALEEARQLRAMWKPVDAVDVDDGHWHSQARLSSASSVSCLSNDGGEEPSRASSPTGQGIGRSKAKPRKKSNRLHVTVSSSNLEQPESAPLGSAVMAGDSQVSMDGYALDEGVDAQRDMLEPGMHGSQSRLSMDGSDVMGGAAMSDHALSRGRSEHQVDLGDIAEVVDEDVDGADFGDTSSTRLRSTSHSSLATSAGQDEDPDMEYMLRFLCVTKWILEGMLVENLATLPPVIYSWMPGRQLETTRARVQFLEEKRRADEQWERVKSLSTHPQGSAGEKVRLLTWQPGQRVMRYPSSKGAIVRHGPSSAAQRFLDSPTLSISDAASNAESHSSARPGPSHAALDSGFRQTPQSSSAGSPLPGRSTSQSSTPVQRKLTPEQMEWLLNHINDQTHRLQRKRPMSSIKLNLTKEEKEVSDIAYQPEANVSLDPERMRQRFTNSCTRKRLIVQTQLMAMERDRYQTCAQKFEALSRLPRNGRLWTDMEKLRDGVATETAAMARRKLLMNYQWFQELENRLPESVHQDQRCRPLIRRLEDLYLNYIQIGPRRLNKAKLMKVLACLRSWELEVPEIKRAIEFVRKDVIYLSDKEFYNWRKRVVQSRPTSKAALRRTVTFPGHSPGLHAPRLMS